MEPIRPDDDELRAEPRTGSASKTPEATDKHAGKKLEGGGKGAAPTAKAAKSAGGGSGRGGHWGVWLALIAVAVAAAGGWFSQAQQIEALESQLEEADYWARQSKLALARFEGDLSETGENLEERGKTLEQKLADQDDRLDTADSEIRKLWAIANERNKKRLNDHEARLESLAGDLQAGGEAREQLAASVDTLESSFSDELAALREELSQQIATLEESSEQTDERLTELDSAMDGVDQLVDQRIQRFEREQKLGIDGLEGRIASLERSMEDVADGSSVSSVRSELRSLKQTVESIDASRAQLTSRLVRLSEQVDSLRSQAAR
ncbi:MAG: hypothetical protein ACQEV6_03450 [Pseudomonadota bacterium]